MPKMDCTWMTKCSDMGSFFPLPNALTQRCFNTCMLSSSQHLRDSFITAKHFSDSKLLLSFLNDHLIICSLRVSISAPALTPQASFESSI